MNVVENDKLGAVDLSACRQMGGVEGVSSDARDENIVRDKHVQEPVDSTVSIFVHRWWKPLMHSEERLLHCVLSSSKEIVEEVTY